MLLIRSVQNTTAPDITNQRYVSGEKSCRFLKCRDTCQDAHNQGVLASIILGNLLSEPLNFFRYVIHSEDDSFNVTCTHGCEDVGRPLLSWEELV